MGLLSFGRHKEDAAEDSAYTAQAADDASAARPKARKKTRAAEPIDPVLPEKQRARRRLVGAVALVLAAVIGLPMILDPEPKPLASDISIDIPAKDRAKPAPGAAATSVPAAAALDQSEEIVSPEAASAKADNGKALAAGAAAVAGAAAIAKPDSAKPDSGKTPAAAKPESRAADSKLADNKPAAKSDTKPDPKDSARKADDARAKAILDGQAVHADKSESYLLQVAALASPDKVRELQNKLKAAGIKSSTQKVATQSGERIRVRVGPVQGRAEAEKMRARLNKLGLNGTLVPA